MPKKSDLNSKSLQHILNLIRIKDRGPTFCLGAGGVGVASTNLCNSSRILQNTSILFDMLARHTLGPTRRRKGLKRVKQYDILANLIMKGLQRIHNLFSNKVVEMEPKPTQLMYRCFSAKS